MKSPAPSAVPRGDSPSPEPWHLWVDAARSPYLNMAIDEALLETAAERARPLLRLYRWDRPSVSIGYVQRAAAVERGERTLVRRPTGGGIVYHDHDITYTVVLPPGHWINAEDRMVSYRWINRAVQRSLESPSRPADLSSARIPRAVDRATMVCFANPTRYDIMHGESKIAGSAQRRTRDGLLHQGSINLTPPSEETAHTVWRDLPTGFQAVLGAEFAEWTPDTALLSNATEREERRYATHEWNYRR